MNRDDTHMPMRQVNRIAIWALLLGILIGSFVTWLMMLS